MSKKYKGKTCVYCAKEGASFTGDHVIARSFFSETERDNLPQVPTCIKCNNQKSTLETYLTALLPQGAQHREDVSSYWEDSRKRIEKNQRLQRELKSGATIFKKTDETGNTSTNILLPIDSGKILELSKYIARGLLFHHWKKILPKNQIIKSQFASRNGDSHFSNVMEEFRQSSKMANLGDILKTIGPVELGNQAFIYEGLFSPLDGNLSMWRLNFYRVTLGIPEAKETTSSIIILIPSLSDGLQTPEFPAKA